MVAPNRPERRRSEPVTLPKGKTRPTLFGVVLLLYALLMGAGVLFGGVAFIAVRTFQFLDTRVPVQ